MHFDLTVTAGQLILFTTLIGVIWRIEVFSSWLLFEHELLIEWYCKSHGLEPGDLMSRKMRYGFLSMLRGAPKADKD